MMKIDTSELISVTEAGREGISKLVNAASEGKRFVILRQSRPAAAIVDIETMERLQRIDELEDDLRLVAIALVRTLTDSGERYDLDDVAAEFGVDLNED
jgi:prevent-host-death family protein